MLFNFAVYLNLAQMASAKNTIFYNQTSKDTVPASTALTGTITSAAASRELVGTGTAFISQVTKGDWIVDLTHNEIRRILNIPTDNTSLELESGFTNALSSATLYFIKKTIIKYIGIVPDNVSVTIDGAAVPVANIFYNFDKGSRGAKDSHSPTDFVDPIIVDATSHNAGIIILE